MYKSCEECDRDVEVEFDFEEAVGDTEDEDSETGGDVPTSDKGVRALEDDNSVPDEAVPAPQEDVPVRTEGILRLPGENAAKHLPCTIYVDYFEALPSHDAYTSEKPMCGLCVWAHMRQWERYCTNCGGPFEAPMRPHWYRDEYDSYEDGLY